MIEGIVVAGVIWFFLAGIGFVILYMGSAAIGGLIADDDGSFIGTFIGWVLGALWALFAIIQVVIHIVHLVEEIAR